MGLDRFANFISKSINGDGIDEINIDSNIRKIVSNHIIFDLNFLIYQEIVDIENEINDIIKIILCLPFAPDKNEVLEELLKSILTQKHWKSYYLGTDLENLFDGFNEDEIIQKFIKFITNKVSSSYSENNEPNNNSLTILELVIYEKITNILVNYIEHIHHTQFIQSLSIFYDGIPSISKVIEQRKRRVKNFLESNEKKELFKKYFDKLINNNKNLFENLSKNYINSKYIILFDYFKWIKNRFSIDKSIGPSSNFIKNLELFMNIRINQYFPKRKIFINSAKDNGESDLKIFKYISSKEINGDYCIHTTDSDLIHQILVQQTYYKIINKDINFTVVKYIKNYTNFKKKIGNNEFNLDVSNNLSYAQVLESNLIIKNILDLYNNLNGIKTNNYKIVWDLCLIFYLFGNDHLPSSVEIGPELGLDFFIKKHYQSLNKSNIINIKKSHIVMDLANFKIYLEKINETSVQNITRIILQRFFKININLINLLVDKLSLDFGQILNFLEVFITIIGKKMDPKQLELLDDSDLRKLFVITNKLDDLKIIGFDESKIKLISDNFDMIQENISFYEHDFNGLILYSKPQNITKDPYQDIYNFISDKATNNLIKKYPIYYDHLDVNQHLKLIENLKLNLNQDPNDYLKKMYHLVITQFGNMTEFHSDNLTWYKYLYTPSLTNLINYIEEIPLDVNQTKKWLTEIKQENVGPVNYLNSINHHLLITPFISFYNLPPEIKKIIGELEPIDNLWLEQTNLKELVEQIEKFNYRSIDIVKFFKNWNDALMRINLNSKTNKINEEIINLNMEFM
jgi:hypothetical protein